MAQSVKSLIVPCFILQVLHGGFRSCVWSRRFFDTVAVARDVVRKVPGYVGKGVNVGRGGGKEIGESILQRLSDKLSTDQ
jgi:hypothetical protein